MAHTPIARPCRAASGCAWHTLPGWRSRSPPIGAHDPRWPAHCRITGCQVVRGMTLFGNRSPRIVVLRRKGRTFADAGGACRAVIGCALAGGAGDCDRPRQDRLPGLRRGFWRCFD